MYRHARTSCSIAALVFLAIGSLAVASDWPTYLHDMARSGLTADTLTASTLAQQWVFTPPVAPATGWGDAESGSYYHIYDAYNVLLPSLQATRYDDSYHVAVQGNNIFFSASGECKIYSVDASTAAIRWVFSTDAPCRVSPHVVGTQLYVGCDDGYAYCLNVADGSLAWKYRYSGIGTDKCIGQGFMVSSWPVRTSVLVDSGIAYFTQGLYPDQGQFVVAINASNQSLVWKNDTLATNNGTNILPTAGNTAPQGYILANGTQLVIPQGHMGPCVFNRSTGAVQYQFPNTGGGAMGGTYCTLASNIVYNGTQMLTGYDLTKTGATYKWGQTMSAPPVNSWVAGRCVVVNNGMIYMTTNKDIFAITQANMTTSAGASDPNAVSPVDQHRDYSLCTWRTQNENVPESLIMAGTTLFAGGNGKVCAYDSATGTRLWSATVDGLARGLAVANGRLFVSTATGKIYCFASGSASGTVIAPTFTSTPFPSDSLETFYSQTADTIVNGCGYTSASTGYVFILGGGDGRLAYELSKRTSLQIYAVDPNATTVAAAKTALSGAGLWGTRIIVENGTLDTSRYPRYFANLVIDQEGFFGGSITVTASQLCRVLRPAGGVAYVGQPNGGSAFGSVLSATTVQTWCLGIAPSCTATYTNSLAKVSRAKLWQAGDWTHQGAGPGNTVGSDDQAVRPPFKPLWFGLPSPKELQDRHNGPPAQLVANGRMFVQGVNVILGYDLYNGTFLWRRAITGCSRTTMTRECSNMAAANDTSLFLVVGAQCYKLDAATGSTLMTYNMPTGTGARWDWVAAVGNMLYGSGAPNSNSGYNANTTVFALDITTGATKWTYTIGSGIVANSTTYGDGKVFFADKNMTQAQKDQAINERIAEVGNFVDHVGNPITPDPRLIVALDASTGTTLWTRPRDMADCCVNPLNGDTCGGDAQFMYKNGYLVVCGSPAHQDHEGTAYSNGDFQRRSISVFSGATGTKLWSGSKNYRTRPVILGTTIFAEPLAFDLATGTQRTSGGSNWSLPSRGGCGGFSASYDMLFFRLGSTGYYDMSNNSGLKNVVLAQRPSCWVSFIPAGGVVSMPYGGAYCTCGYAVEGSMVSFSKDYEEPVRPPDLSCKIFYNNCRFDGNNAAANASDDAAIALDKAALLSGGTATFANYTNYSKGINGIMVDIPSMPGTPAASDFTLKKGNSNTPSSWTTVTMKSSYISVRKGAGANGTDRVTLTFPDGLIYNTWLQLTVKASVNTGVTSDVVYYFGNAIGETGNSTSSARVDTADLLATQQDVHKTFANPASISDACDFNRDGKVDSADQVITRSNVTTITNELKLITVP